MAVRPTATGWSTPVPTLTPAKPPSAPACTGWNPTRPPTEVVARIFERFLAGHGYYAIAERLTAEGIPSPAGYDRARNPHRLGRAWAKSAVRAILRNPRYTGYQVWGRQRRDEMLLDVNDVAAGQGHWIRGEAYYRCRYPAEYAAADFDHPKSVYLRETGVVRRLDTWLAELFSPANLDHTCHTLATASRSDPAGDQRRLPPKRCWSTANAALTATGPPWRPAPTPPWCNSGSPRSAPPEPLPKRNSATHRQPPTGSRPSRFGASSSRPAD